MSKAFIFFIVTLSITFKCSAQKKKLDWHCPEIAYYKDHWKKNKANGLYYFDVSNMEMLKYKRIPPQKDDVSCTRYLNPKQIKKILGKPNQIKINFSPGKTLYIYNMDTSLAKNLFNSQPYILIYVLFDDKTNLARNGFDLQTNIPPMP